MTELESINATTLKTILGDLDGKGADGDVLVGSRTDRFLPIINISKWNDEAWIAFNYEAMRIDREIVVFDGAVADLNTEGVRWRSYVLPGSTKVLENEIYLDVAPPDNKIRLKITDSGNLEYLYQPVDLSIAIDRPDAVAYRPPNVQGSYAVYIRGKRDNKYKTGKLCHLYRWDVTDNFGKKYWCDPLRVEDGELIIGLPKECVYPIKAMGAGDTFGIQAEGASEGGLENTISAAADSPASDGTTTQISAFIRESNTNNEHDFQTAIYDDSDDSLVGVSAELVASVTTTSAWHNFAIVQGILATGVYAIAIFCNPGAGAGRIMYDVQAGEGRQTDGGAYDYDVDGFPASVTWAGDPIGNRYSIHCDYTVSGGGGLSIPIVMHHYTKHR